MVLEPDRTVQRAPQDNQLMSKHRVLSFKPQLRLEWQGHDGQNEIEQPNHSASLGDSIMTSTRIRFSVHTGSEGNEIKDRRHRETRLSPSLSILEHVALHARGAEVQVLANTMPGGGDNQLNRQLALMHKANGEVKQPR
jgi:hypothetical protein